MGIFGRWKTKQLRAAWSYSAQHTLWRLIASQDRYFVIEDRDTSAKTVSFSCIDRATGRVLWEQMHLNERWWVSMESVVGDTILFHEFASPDMPDHKKIHAVDLRTGRLAWFNNEMNMLFAHDESLYAVRDEYDRRRFFEIDLHTGAMKREIDDTYLNVLRETLSSRTSELIQFPETYDIQYEQGNGSLSHYVHKVVDLARPTGLIEVLEKKSNIIIGWYEQLSSDPSQNVYRQSIHVIDKESRRELFRDQLIERSPACAPDAFFAIEDWLYYVKNKRLLVAVHLSSSLNGKN